MLAPITNNRITPAYCAVNPVFKGNYKTQAVKIADSGKNIIKEAPRKKPVALLFASIMAGLIGMTGRKVDFDKDTGKLLRLNEYKDGQLSKVKHFSGRLFRWESIDEYKDGKIAKTTHFYKRKNIPDWEMIYKEDGDNIIRNFYPNGKLESYQHDKNDILSCRYLYDENGKNFKYERYNPDETLAYAILYGDDYNTLESYENGILKYSEITFDKGNVFKRKINYDKNNEVTSVEELGKGYRKDYTYIKGGKHSSVTRYSEGNISRLEVIYNVNGTSALEFYYNREGNLCERKEYPDENTKITTKYNDKGKVILSEKVDLRTNKFTRKLWKNSK